MTMEDRTGGIDRATPGGGSTTEILGSNTSAMINDVSPLASYPLQRANKRSFDVAFLVAPDENLARRQSERLRLVSNRKNRRDDTNDIVSDPIDRSPQNLTTNVRSYTENVNDRRSMIYCTENSLSPPYQTNTRDISSNLLRLSPDSEIRRYPSLQTRLQKTPSPPDFPGSAHQLSCPDAMSESSNLCLTPKGYDSIKESRSAFTKVNLMNQRNNLEDGQTSPRSSSSISPDYRKSVSPPSIVSPCLTGATATGYKYTPFPSKMAYPFLVSNPDSGPPSGGGCAGDSVDVGAVSVGGGSGSNSNGVNHPGNILENLRIPHVSHPPKIPSPKIPAYRPDLPPVYPTLPYNPISVFPPMAEALVRPRFLATAAGVAGLLPPSFAAFTLPAQNVCAKCNLSFRMTSDLVYHMRSHHKSESTSEAARRRREEKLRCPVCDESFRERHHLTRHMTAHQDKESDAIVDQVEMKRRVTAVHGK